MKHNWEFKRLGEVCEILMGQSPDSSTYNEIGEGLPFFQGCAEFGDMYPTAIKYCREPIKIAHENDILFSVRAPIGTMNFANSKCCIGRGLCSIRAKQNSIQKYIYYVLDYSKHKLLEKGTGSTFKSTNKDNLNKHLIPVPPMEVQKRIVAELDAVNEGISELREQVKDLDSLAKTLYYETFGDPISNPKAWPVKKIGDIGEVIGGSTPKTNNENYWNGDLLWITPAELKGPKYIYDTERHITEEGRKSAGLQLLPINTVLLTSRAPIGKVAIVKTPMYCNQGFKNIRINEKFIHHEYLFFVLLFINDVLQEKGKGSTFKEISKTVTENIHLPIPPLSLQQQFAAQIEEIEAMKRELESQIAEAQTLLDSRMDYWFN